MARIADEKSREAAEKSTIVSRRLFLFLILGFALVFIGTMVILIDAILYGSGSANVGAVIFIGPFPIVIGAGPDVTLIVLFSIILAVLSIVVFLVMNRKTGRLES
ncbi:MAG: DUF131 domain-containing protein [Candidatus Bathyarchaeota archaeon]|nr:MAG: DUF131 domain-containing protein [Candidatus Bathyarchaeota archaeon]